MYIVIAGAGLMGLSLAERLVGHQHDVLVIDPDPVACEYAQTEIGVMAQAGSATSAKILETAGLKRADVAVAMMRNDADNLAFLLLARSVGVPRRLVRMRESEFEHPYLLAGATAIASSVAPLIDQLMVNIEYPEVKSLMRLGRGNIDVFEVTVPADSPIAGRTVEAIVQDLHLPPTCNFVAVEQGDGELEVARGTTLVPPGANVIMLAKEADLQPLIELLTRPGAS
jgi:trk system potassium uptake protein TrkA